jgi:nitrite reductase (NO-forming)
MRIAGLLALAALAAIGTGCTGAFGATEEVLGGPFKATGLPKINGQIATCAGPRDRSFSLEARETEIDLGMGVRFEAWAYNGQLPGPVLEACEGDMVTITLTNHGNTSHGLDSHAFRADTMHFGPVGPGMTMKIEKRVDTPGVFMYHCAAGPVTDLHIKSGLNGAMIVYPRSKLLRRARELVVVESGVFGERDRSGIIPGTDPNRAMKNDPTLMMFNGRLSHAPLTVQPGDLVRAYVVNVGPGTSAVHVMGTILDTVYDGSSVMHDVQTYAVPAGSGAVVEFRIPEEGMYGLVDHDRLAYLQYGMVIPFMTTMPGSVDTH